jgi:small nuclear ribonucleoprotein (snRNP)-like protein
VRKLTAYCLISLLLISFAHVTSAKPQSDWSNLKNFIGQPIAIKTADGVTSFGVLVSVDVSEITVHLADEVERSIRETPFKRAEVTKVWRAKFRFGEKKTGRGALIGLGAGLGAGYLAAFVLAQRENSGAPHGFGLFPIVGAGVGAMIGASKYKGHKKQKLIYSI